MLKNGSTYVVHLLDTIGSSSANKVMNCDHFIALLNTEIVD